MLITIPDVLSADEVRDALLESDKRGFAGPINRIALAMLGEAVWRAWKTYRNTAVETAYRRGRI